MDVDYSIPLARAFIVRTSPEISGAVQSHPSVVVPDSAARDCANDGTPGENRNCEEHSSLFRSFGIFIHKLEPGSPVAAPASQDRQPARLVWYGPGTRRFGRSKREILVTADFHLTLPRPRTNACAGNKSASHRTARDGDLLGSRVVAGRVRPSDRSRLARPDFQFMPESGRTLRRPEHPILVQWAKPP